MGAGCLAAARFFLWVVGVQGETKRKANSESLSTQTPQDPAMKLVLIRGLLPLCGACQSAESLQLELGLVEATKMSSHSHRGEGLDPFLNRGTQKHPKRQTRGNAKAQGRATFPGRQVLLHTSSSASDVSSTSHGLRLGWCRF